MNSNTGKSARLAIYAASFFYTVHNAFTLYITSSFLARFIDTEFVGVLYGIGSLLGILVLSKSSALLGRFGQFRTTLAFLALNIGAVAGLAFIDTAWLVLTLFLALSVATLFLRLDLDVYLEKFSVDKKTGALRGVFLTLLNVAVFISPYLVGKILTDSQYERVFFVSALLIIPTIAIVATRLRGVADIPYRQVPFGYSLKRVWDDPNLANIFGATFLLEFFYSWMVIYTPIYLSQYIGFSWSQIGAIFSIMLMPFVILQYPLGRIADRWLGEKEILTAGFCVMGLATISLAFIGTSAFGIWAAALFATRVGASAVEVMNESYFFKHVGAEDTDIISVFRDSRPLAFIAGPLVGSLVISFLPYNILFLILGGLMLLGITFSVSLIDTK
ncbi:MAG: MFS transporter [Candidatus Vogelbacteria bacterium]|nr:MFS transporter [Candidatus Vogelbacteria bacterium]